MDWKEKKQGRKFIDKVVLKNGEHKRRPLHITPYTQENGMLLQINVYS